MAVVFFLCGRKICLNAHWQLLCSYVRIESGNKNGDYCGNYEVMQWN